jgi:hypothetical protein
VDFDLQQLAVPAFRLYVAFTAGCPGFYEEQKTLSEKMGFFVASGKA